MAPTKVMFLQSQVAFGSDSLMHSLLMRNLDRDDFEVEVACNAGRSGRSHSITALSQLPDVRVRRVNFGPSVHMRSRRNVALDALRSPLAGASLASLVAYIRRNRIRILHGTEKPRDAFLGVLLGKLSGAKSVVHLHVGYDHGLNRQVRWAVRHADHVIGVSRFVADSALASGRDPSTVSHIHNAIETAGWDPTIDGSALRAEYGIEPDAPVVAIAARIFYWKGHGHLVRAVDRAHREVPNLRLLIVGADDVGAHPGRTSYSAELQQMVRERGLEDVVTFTGLRSDIPRVLAAADIFALPTMEEPCAVALLEAMSMRKPVLGGTGGGTPEVIDAGRGGFLHDFEDDATLAEQIVTLARDPELRRQFGDHNRRRVEEYFTPRRMADDLANIYRRILTPAGAPAGGASRAEQAAGRR